MEEFTSEHLTGGQLVANRYEIIALLGSGGMGAVYRVRDNVLGGEELAMKVLHRQFAYDQKYTQRFLREVQLMRRVNHQNVVRTYDVGADDDLVYFTMEFVPGRSLLQVMESQSLTRSHLINLILQVCEGLTAVHEAGIVHRDLKPENIIILDDGVVKITDFGVARPEDSQLTAHNEVIGSSAYIAPEVWLGEVVTSAVDLYALGVILYEIGTGIQPFEADTPAAMMRLHLDRQPLPARQVNSNIPPWLSKLTMQLLEKNPKKRPRSARDIVKQLQLLNLGDERVTLADTGKISDESKKLFSHLENISVRSTDGNATSSVRRDTRSVKPVIFQGSQSAARAKSPFKRLFAARSSRAIQTLGRPGVRKSCYVGTLMTLAGVILAQFVTGYRSATLHSFTSSELSLFLVPFLSSIPLVALLAPSKKWGLIFGAWCFAAVLMILSIVVPAARLLYPLYQSDLITTPLVIETIRFYQQQAIESPFLSSHVTDGVPTILGSRLIVSQMTREAVTSSISAGISFTLYAAFTLVIFQWALRKSGFRGTLIYLYGTGAIATAVSASLVFPDIFDTPHVFEFAGYTLAVFPNTLLVWGLLFFAGWGFIPSRGARA